MVGASFANLKPPNVLPIKNNQLKLISQMVLKIADRNIELGNIVSKFVINVPLRNETWDLVW